LSQTVSWKLFQGSFNDWMNHRDPNEWQRTSSKQRFKGLTYQLWWSSRQGGIWVRVK